jgi:hypothetical protein
MRQRSAVREMEETETALREARIKRDEAMSALRRIKPVVLPEIPTFETQYAMAKQQCPGRDEAELKLLAGRLRSCVAGANFREYDEMPAPVITGTEIRDVRDSHYNIRAPKPLPERKQEPAGPQPSRRVRERIKIWLTWQRQRM